MEERAREDGERREQRRVSDEMRVTLSDQFMNHYWTEGSAQSQQIL